MGLSNIKHGERIQMVEYVHQFTYADMPSAGFSFPVNNLGSIIQEKMQDAGRANYAACLSGMVNGSKVIDNGIQTRRWSFWQCGHGTCVCGQVVELERDYGNGIDCKCGRIYNSGGQELAPRGQWDVDPVAEFEAEEDERMHAESYDYLERGGCVLED